MIIYLHAQIAQGDNKTEEKESGTEKQCYLVKYIHFKTLLWAALDGRFPINTNCWNGKYVWTRIPQG